MISVQIRLLGTALLFASLCAPSTAQKTATLHLPETDSNITIRYEPVSAADSETFRTLVFRGDGHTYRLTSRFDLCYFRESSGGGIGFHDDGSPYKALQFKEFNMTSFDHTHGTPPAIIGKRYLSEVMGFAEEEYDPYKPYATTYDPYSVYLIQPSQPAQYSFPASKLYNQAHYVWAGPESREDYAVVYNLPNHKSPFGVPASRLDKLFGHPATK